MKESAPKNTLSTNLAEDGGLPNNDILRLRKLLGQNAYPVATEKFLGKSKERYANPPWLAREIAQNFIDHNPGENKGTLNGVSIVSETLNDNKTSRFTIKGGWPFKDVTGLITLHSAKPEGETAGGNGIGLKQTALILLRDFGVKRFEVVGEKWDVAYRLVPKKEGGLDHDWLVAEQKKSENSGECSYIIETDNPAIITALRELPNIVVGSENTFLQKLNFENKKGSFKWLPPEEKGKEPGTGRLFINGQVMDVADGPDSNGWKGMRGCTLQLNNVDYKMSIDRPPLNKWDLMSDMRKMADLMTPSELAEQIAQSEAIWSAARKEDKWEALELIDKLVWDLSWKITHPKSNTDIPKIQESLKKYFTEKKYLARDEKLPKEMEAKLVAEGYILCPSFFAKIGMPSVLEKMDINALTREQKPDAAAARYARDSMAEKNGVEVGYVNLETLPPEEFIGIAYSKLQPFIENIEIKDKTDIRITLKTNVPEGFLLKSALSGNSDAHTLLGSIRTIAAYGLSKKILTHTSFIQGNESFNFGTDQESGFDEPTLLVRKVKVGETEGNKSFLEINTNPDFADHFQTWTQGVPEVHEVQPETQKKEGFKMPRKALMIGLSATLLLAGITKKFSDREEKPLKDKGKITETIPDGKKEKTSPSITINPERMEEVNKNNKTYSEWRSQHKEMIDKTKYPDAKSLENLVDSYQKARILSNKKEGGLEGGNVIINPDVIEEFDIVKAPSNLEMQRLVVLRDITYELTGILAENSLFVFTGRGAKGVNMRKDSIGMHQELMSGGLMEAFSTFIHEVAHNNPNANNHDDTFIKTLSSLHVQAEERLLATLAKTNNGERLSETERRILDLVKQW